MQVVSTPNPSAERSNGTLSLLTSTSETTLLAVISLVASTKTPWWITTGLCYHLGLWVLSPGSLRRVATLSRCVILHAVVTLLLNDQ